MGCTTYPRVPRAVLCAALLLSQHAVVNANNWTTGRASSSRSSTLAVMQPGGRNRPVRDWKAIKRESEEKLKKQAEDKANEKAAQAGELVEAVEDEVQEVVDTSIDHGEIAALDLEESTPENLGITLAKVAVIATVGMYGARKVVAFAKAFVKARKEAAEEASGEISPSPGRGVCCYCASPLLVQVAGEEAEEQAASVGAGEDDDESGFVTADEEEGDGTRGASAMLGGVSKAAKDVKERAESSLENLKTGLAEAVNREGDGEESVTGDVR
ncbi:unnamed protein product [Scytosiphon promiscuus]